MPKRTRSYRSWQMDKLANPKIAADYLNACLHEAPETFLGALKSVAQAHQMAKVAREAGVQRETLYRSLSEQGNPTLDTLSSVLGAVGLTFNVSPKVTQDTPSSSVPTVMTEPSQSTATVTEITTPVTGTTTGRVFYSAVFVAGNCQKTYPGSLWDQLANRIVPDEPPLMFVETLPPLLLGGLAWRGEETRRR